MGTTRAQVSLHTVDADEENYVTNVWAFNDGSLAGFDASATTILKAFYDSLSTYLSPAIAQNGHTIKWYSLPLGPPPNYPTSETTFNLTSAPSGTAMPSEVATCLSFQGVTITGQPQRRRRGRIYLGPLNSTALGIGTDAGRVSATLRTGMTTAADTLANSIMGLGAARWGVWSGTDSALVNVDNGWIDNAFDTQRRRGLADTARTTFTV